MEQDKVTQSLHDILSGSESAPALITYMDDGDKLETVLEDYTDVDWDQDGITIKDVDSLDGFLKIRYKNIVEIYPLA